MIVLLTDAFDHHRLRGTCLLKEVLRNVLLADGDALLCLVVVDGLHVDQVDNTYEALLGADGQYNWHRVRAQFFADVIDDTVEVGSGAIHLVDEGDARDAVLLCLAPDGLRLGLHSTHGAEECHGPVKHAERPLHLGREVDVPRRIDDVDLVVLPVRGCRSRCNGDASLLLLDHPVHRRLAVMDLAQPMGSTREVEDALGDGGLAGIYVGREPDVPDSADVVAAGHVLPQCEIDDCVARAPPGSGSRTTDCGHANPDRGRSQHGRLEQPWCPESRCRLAPLLSCLLAGPRSSAVPR